MVIGICNSIDECCRVVQDIGYAMTQVVWFVPETIHFERADYEHEDKDSGNGGDGGLDRRASVC